MSGSVFTCLWVVCLLNSPTIRHGIHGGFNRRSQPGPPRAWWRSRSHHHLLLGNYQTSTKPICFHYFFPKLPLHHPTPTNSPVWPKQYPRIPFIRVLFMTARPTCSLIGLLAFCEDRSFTFYCFMKVHCWYQWVFVQCPSSVAFLLVHPPITTLIQSGEVGGFSLIVLFVCVIVYYLFWGGGYGTEHATVNEDGLWQTSF